MGFWCAFVELAEVYPSARNPATGARLWKLTEEVVGPLPAFGGALMTGA